MNTLLWILGNIKAILFWCWNHKIAASYIIFILLMAYLGKQIYEYKKSVEILQTENSGLTKDNKILKDKVNSLITSRNGKVTVIYRDRDVIKEVVKYLPPEGTISITEYNKLKDENNSIAEKLKKKILENPSLAWLYNFIYGTTIDTGTNVIHIKDRGITCKIGSFIIYDGQYNKYPINAGIDAKLLFYQRYSMGLATTIDYPGIFISRHLDDVSFGFFNNLEIEGVYGKPYREFDKNIFGIGFRSNW